MIFWLRPLVSLFLWKKNDPKKTKGVHVKEIHAFKRFFKAKWNPQCHQLSIYDANIEFQQKKAIHDAKWRGTFYVEYVTNPSIKPKQFRISFKFPPFPSVSFGLVESYPDPTVGALGVDVEPPRKQVTFAKFYMQPHERHLATQYTRVVEYPSFGSLASQIFFHFFYSITNHYSPVYFLLTEPTPINVPNKPLRKEENYDNKEEEVANKDKALEEEPKHQKGKHKANTTKGVFKAPKSRKTISSNLPLLLFPRRLLISQRKERPR